MDARPSLALDLDGVIVRPPLGWNVAISRRLDARPLPARIEPATRCDRWNRAYWLLRAGLEAARYAGRQPLPGVREALTALAARRRLVVVSGRRWVVRPLVERWLARHGLRDSISALYLNDRRLPSAQFKLWMLRRLGIREHVEDDGGTAYYLASHGITVYLCDWPRNRDLPYPPGVERVRDLRELAAHLGAAPAAPRA